jgi:predicted nuclease of predicted toxin-antitoxin system
VRRVISQHAGDYGTIIYDATRLRLRRGERGGRSGGNAGCVSSATAPIPLVLDQGLPRDTASILRQGGHDCVHVGEIGMSSAADREIIAWAREHRRTVVTLDADFHAEMAVSRALNPSVIRLRFQRLDGPAVAQLVRFVVAEYGAALVQMTSSAPFGKISNTSRLSTRAACPAGMSWTTQRSRSGGRGCGACDAPPGPAFRRVQPAGKPACSQDWPPQKRLWDRCVPPPSPPSVHH